MSTTEEKSSNPRGRQGNRGGRNRGRSRDRDNNRNNRNESNNRNGDRSRSRNPRSRSGGSRPVAPPTFGEKLISFLTFGLVKPGKGKKRAPAASATKSKTATARSSTKSKPRERTSAGKKTAPSRAPEIREVTSGRLYVGNLSYDTSESDLTDLFKGVGGVVTAEVISHKRTMRSKGYAFVEMVSLQEAKRAVEVLHDKEFMGRKIVVSGAKAERSSNERSSSDRTPHEGPTTVRGFD